jgi:predicted branched-subunit amino acid permease
MIDNTSQPATVPAGQPRQAAPSQRRKLLLVLLVACIVGIAAGLLAHAAGDKVPSAVLTGGGAFAGTVGLLLAITRQTGVPD